MGCYNFWHLIVGGGGLNLFPYPPLPDIASWLLDIASYWAVKYDSRNLKAFLLRSELHLTFLKCLPFREMVLGETIDYLFTVVRRDSYRAKHAKPLGRFSTDGTSEWTGLIKH